MNLGDTFINNLPGSFERLWVVCSNPDQNGTFVIFSLEKWKERFCDETCIILPNEHPFITQKHVVDYHYGRHLTVEAKNNMDKLNSYTPHEPVNRDLLQRIQQGALDSIHTPPLFQTPVQASLISE